jgi:hypothetical protein
MYRGVAGFACCHIGAGEAWSGRTFVKFAAARPGEDAPQIFSRLLDACEAVAAERGCNELVAGINAARHEAYRPMIDRGFRVLISGVAMLRPDAPAFNRPVLRDRRPALSRQCSAMTPKSCGTARRLDGSMMLYDSTSMLPNDSRMMLDWL